MTVIGLLAAAASGRRYRSARHNACRLHQATAVCESPWLGCGQVLRLTRIMVVVTMSVSTQRRRGPGKPRVVPVDGVCS